MESKNELLLHSKTLRRRFITILAVYTAIILVMWFIYQKTVFRTIRENVYQTIDLAENSLFMELDDEFSRMALVSSVLSGSVYVQEFLAEQDPAAYYEKAGAVAEIIRKTTYPHINADSIITITEGGSFYRFTGGISNNAVEKIYKKVLNEGMTSYSVIELDETDYFCMISPVYPRNSGVTQPLGYVVTLSNLAKVRRTLLALNTISGIDTAVIFDDVILLSSNPGLDGQKTSVLDQLYGSVKVLQVKGSNLYAATAITKEAFYYAEQVFLTISLATLMVLLITLVVLYRMLSSRMVTPMLKNADNMRMGLLKTQISTHFIVNTVDCIESLAEQGETQKTAAAAHNLACMLRTLHEADEEINIYEQLEHLNYYIEIMNIRTGGKFIIDMDIDDVLVEYRIPAHILQPIVENALIHGMGNKSYDCCLKIIGRVELGSIILEVSDNGKGMQEDIMCGLQKALDAADELEYTEHSLNGVALLNIQRRIRTCYGSKYGLALSGSPGKGLTVTVCLPMIEDK